MCFLRRRDNRGAIADASARNYVLRRTQSWAARRALAEGARTSQIAPMTQEPMSRPDDERSDDPQAVPAWGIVGGGLLLALTALAAPFYTEVMGGLIWAGETIRALCGW